MAKRKRSGSSSTRRSKKRKVFGPKARRTIKTLAKQVVNRNVETKYLNKMSENNPLYHNLWVPISHRNFDTVNGTSGGYDNIDTRVGESVRAKYLKVKLWLSNKSDRNDVIYRIVCLKYQPDLSFSAVTGNITVQTVGATGPSILRLLNTDRYTIVFDQLVQVKNGSGMKAAATGGVMGETHKVWSKTIKLHGKKMEYQDGSDILKNQDDCYGLYIVAYDAFGTLTTDNIASYHALIVAAFKDA
ncbi:capsid protein [Blackfly DNA virus 19]|nr:capsid protein [Blackfly DNA virus 19]